MCFTDETFGVHALVNASSTVSVEEKNQVLHMDNTVGSMCTRASICVVLGAIFMVIRRTLGNLQEVFMWGKKQRGQLFYLLSDI